ncbi:MAG: 30S ribosomal protein S21 [Candidatus Pacebacteria bacterium]|nr:30S ribosomal protein S21 [Candidatus Paceibacterota bacterium]
MINVEVTKKNNENITNLIRRFTKRMQGSGVLRRVRKIRYWDRPASDFKKKQTALRKMGRREEFEKLYKQGKISMERGRRRF